MSKVEKVTIQNVKGRPLPLADLTLGFAEVAEVELTATVQNALDNGEVVVVEKDDKKGTK